MINREQLERTIVHLESQRTTLGDAVVDTAIATLREKLEALTPAALVEQRKQVTILFADLVGWTAMAEKMDPEDVREIQQAYFKAITRPIRSYGGRIEKYIGDAVLAVFGVPETHEDDAQRAVRASLAMQEAMIDLNNQLSALPFAPLRLSLRIGIHTGLVISTIQNDGTFVVTGDTVNLAARLQAAAEPETILVSEDTFRLVAHVAEAEALAPLVVKGRSEPVALWRVDGWGAVRGKLRGVAGLNSPLVGRERELVALQESLERLRRGIGGIATIVGDAGIGKSRLVAELRRPALLSPGASATLQWVEGRCLSYGSTIPYLLWLDVLRSTLGITLDEQPEAVRDHLKEWVRNLCPDSFQDVYPYLARIMSLPMEGEQIAALGELDGPTLKQRTFAAATTAIATAASRQPLVIVCEDLHWADGSSIDLLEHLASLTDQVGCLFICLFRPDPDHTSWRFREMVARQYRHRHLDLWLRPLTIADSEHLVEHLLGHTSFAPAGEEKAREAPSRPATLPTLSPFQDPHDRLPFRLTWRILGVSEGNPFFVEEVIRSLINAGTLVQDETTGRWRAMEEEFDLPIPETLQRVLIARIDRLPKDARHVLQLAAVVGSSVPLRVLAAVANGEYNLGQQLLTLQREGMIREVARLPEPEYSFKHELLREAAYHALLRKDRKLLHRQVAVALEELYAVRDGERVGLLAQHWLGAGNLEKAIDYLLLAGDQARALYAHGEAEASYQMAIELLSQDGDGDLRAKTLLKLGLVYTADFKTEEASAAYQQAFTLLKPQFDAPPSPSAPFPAEVLRLAIEEPLTLDPGMMQEDVSTFMGSQLFEGLVEVDEDHNVLPAVASSWEVTDGGLKYIFHLRQGLRWNDGTPLTAADFEYAWKRNLSPITRSPIAHLLYPIRNARHFAEGHLEDAASVGATTIDPLTLEIRLERPTAYLPYLLAHPVAFPLPRHVIERCGQAWTQLGNLVSNGSFELLDWQPGRSLLLKRNASYAGRCTGCIGKVACQVFPDHNTALAAYARSEVDAVSMITTHPGLVARIRATYGEELRTIPRPITFFLIFRADGPPFDDVRLRKAFIHVVDRSALNEIAFENERLPATGGFVPPGMPGHSPTAGLPFDPTAGRRLLAEAGYPGGRNLPQITFIHGPTSGDEKLVAFLKNAWKDLLGVELKVEGLDWKEFLERLQQDPAHLALIGWSADYLDPDGFLRVLFHSREGDNYPRWYSQEFDALVTKAAQVTDQAERLSLYRTADRILVSQEAVVMPLSYGQGRILAKPWVQLNHMPAGQVQLKHITVHPRKRDAVSDR